MSSAENFSVAQSVTQAAETYSAVLPCQTFTVDVLTVQVYESPAAVAIAASHTARQIICEAIAQRDQANVIFATGRSQVQLLDHLTQPETVSAHSLPIDWSRVMGFHLDEYLGLAPDHPASFRHYLAEHLTRRVALGEFHEIEGDGLLPLQVCADYEAKLRAYPADLCFLGIGNNGHLAFNDPDVANFNDPRWVSIVRLDEKNRQQQADSTAFDSLQSVPQYAFTLTLSAICAARRLLCLAFGKNKAAIVEQLLTGPIQPSCPASILRQTPQAVLMIDRAAAGSVFL